MPAESLPGSIRNAALWQPNNNGVYSVMGREANRLTLRANWGQIDSG